MVSICDTTPSNFLYTTKPGRNIELYVSRITFYHKALRRSLFINANKSIFLQQLRWWLTPQQLMEAPFFCIAEVVALFMFEHLFRWIRVSLWGFFQFVHDLF